MALKQCRLGLYCDFLVVLAGRLGCRDFIMTNFAPNLLDYQLMCSFLRGRLISFVQLSVVDQADSRNKLSVAIRGLMARVYRQSVVRFQGNKYFLQYLNKRAVEVYKVVLRSTRAFLCMPSFSLLISTFDFFALMCQQFVLGLIISVCNRNN